MLSRPPDSLQTKAKKLKYSGPSKHKKGTSALQSEQLASMLKFLFPKAFFPNSKGKVVSHHFKSRYLGKGESQDEQEPHLGEEKRCRSESLG